jgi:hypothetical protein
MIQKRHVAGLHDERKEPCTSYVLASQCLVVAYVIDSLANA